MCVDENGCDFLEFHFDKAEGFFKDLLLCKVTGINDQSIFGWTQGSGFTLRITRVSFTHIL